MNTSMDTLMIQIESTTKNATSSIQTLINKLKILNQSLEQVANQSKNFSKLKTALSSTSTVSTPKVTKQKQPFAEYSTKESQFQSLGVDEKSLGKAVSTTKTATQETTKYKNSLGQLITVVEKTKNGLTGYKVTLQDINKETKKNFFKSLTSGFSTTLLNVNLLWHDIKSIASTMGDFVNQAASYYESLNLFSTTLGENSEKALDWVNKFSSALYLDPGQVMQYMGTFDSLISGLGVGEEKAYLMSQQLTQLTYDLASFKNLSFETAFEKLQSGISGEIEPLILAAIVCEYYRKHREPINIGCGILYC